ncbi:sporulation integral membrane protein YtvI [Lutispora thermophila]|uniref:Sporulation integral membrane protein YtvI n=1 Tax=Lutispora thermophila DSM 19022 TaxID=1122184 RepID=A0A1M6BMQ0_9FIRM|nr:sporulation integral membrane protein YtvI [Lutispora thermophila]SHI49937.1 sporulation integral membrane protein YtvI [Lutispora thermophila DSM 19022]
MKKEVDEYTHYILRTLATLLRLIVYTLIFLAAVFGLKIIFQYLSPFIIALLISFLIKPISKIFTSMKLGKGISVAISLLLVYGALFALLTLGLSKGISELNYLTSTLPLYSDAIYKYITDLSRQAQNIYIQLPPEVTTYAIETAKSLLDKMGVLLTNTAKYAVNTLYSLPKLGILFIITSVASFFFAKDSDKIEDFIYRQFTPNWRSKLSSLKKNLLSSLVGFLKAQLILLTMTFMESLIGLNIIGVKYALIISIFVSLVDILPVLGTGSVYVPWAIVSIIIGKYRLGISLLVLYAVIIVIRYMVEPKVVGQQLGIHPLISLISMYVGAKVMGPIGVILGPTIAVTIKATQNVGILPKFK